MAEINENFLKIIFLLHGFPQINYLKKKNLGQALWVTSVILATLEVASRRPARQKKSGDPISVNTKVGIGVHVSYKGSIQRFVVQAGLAKRDLI